MFCRSVMSAVSRANSVEIWPIVAQLLGGQLAAVDADPEHEVLVVELPRLEDRGAAAVDAGPALGVEAPPAEAVAQVGGVDRGEAAVGVDVLDAGPDVERVVVLLGLLVGVERLAEAERPLALAALAGAGPRPWSGQRRSTGDRWWCWGVSCDSSGTQSQEGTWSRQTTTLDAEESVWLGDRAPGEAGGEGYADIHIMLRVMPKSTWRRATRYDGERWQQMSCEESSRPEVPTRSQTRIPEYGIAISNIEMLSVAYDRKSTVRDLLSDDVQDGISGAPSAAQSSRPG